jgi:hypothetical protein
MADNRIIGDRTGKSTLDEMMEVSRARNEEVAEEERIEAERKAKREADRIKKEAEKAIREKEKRDNVPGDNSWEGLERAYREKKDYTEAYMGIEFEPKAPRKRGVKGSYSQISMGFDESFKRILKKGYGRHPLPAEQFSLITGYLEGKLKGKLKRTAEDMIFEEGNWFAMAFGRAGDKLVCYTNPRGIEHDKENEKAYIIHKGFVFDQKDEFSIAGLGEGWIPLEQFNDDLVEFLYGRKYADLPQAFKEGFKIKAEGSRAYINKAEIYLPDDGVIWPLSQGNWTTRLGIVGGYFDMSASRGARVR